MNKSLSRRAFLRTSIASGASLAAAAAGAAPAGIYRPGTYSAKASGIGEVTVTMTFDADRIIDVVLDVSHETPGIGQAAADTLKKNLMAAQAAEIDGVSGATITSKAVSKAAAKCIAQAKGEIPVEVISDKKADEDDGDWLGKEPEIAEKDIVATHETDILVVGCGTGGLFAVAAAAEAGGKVIGIDRFAVGTGIREDLGAIDSRYQKAWGTKIDKFEFITMATQYAGGHIQQDLVKLWCDKSGEAIDWVGDRLAERNIELWHESGDKNDETRYKHFAIGHSPKLPIDPKTGKFKITLAQVVEQYAAKKGARFDYNTKMVKLEKKNGRVTGVIAENADGKYVRYNAAKGVVVATGGYAQNWKMMEALQPWNLRIIGRSGAGKSTLVRCINLLNRPSEGTVTVDGKNLTELSEDELRESRRSIGMIFQHFNLLSSRTVYDNVALPLELVGTPKNVIREKVEPLLKLVGLTEHAHKYPSQLSGGQKQRVGIARALTNDPKVLLSDEATSALDPETTVATLALLKRINKELGLTIVMITHEMQVVKQICERVVVMNYGKIVEQGKVVDIFMSPQHETTKALIGNVMARDMPASILDRFRKARENHPNSDAVYLLRLAFSGNEVTRPVISECSRRFNLDFNILRGTVDDVQGQTLGSLTVLIEAESSVFIEAEIGRASCRERV